MKECNVFVCMLNFDWELVLEEEKMEFVVELVVIVGFFGKRG